MRKNEKGNLNSYRKRKRRSYKIRGIIKTRTESFVAQLSVLWVT